ncbi:MAG: hypothetical protein ACJAZO_001306 [Myxococcota bacterium]|jgi:hypothetical protein
MDIDGHLSAKVMGETSGDGIGGSEPSVHLFRDLFKE